MVRSHIPTPYPEVNTLLQELLTSVQTILASHFIGMYLEGSLANGDFDEDSDIDFVVVTDEEISGNLFSALQAMHARIAAIDSEWAIQLEGSYVSQAALRRYDPELDLHPNLERGRDERLKMVRHDDTWGWMIHRYLLRERGITLVGPPPQTLIDPILPDDLRQAMRTILHGWATQILNDRNRLNTRGYQSFTVLSLCRILYTLQFGDIVSKRKAARWVKETTGEKWSALIDQTWIGRHHPQEVASPDEINQTLDLIRYVRERGEQFKTLPPP